MRAFVGEVSQGVGFKLERHWVSEFSFTKSAGGVALFSVGQIFVSPQRIDIGVLLFTNITTKIFVSEMVTLMELQESARFESLWAI